MRRLTLLAVLAGCAEAPSVQDFSGRAMGTTWRIQVVGGDGTSGSVMESCLERWEQATSLWRRDSSIRSFNAHASGEWFPVEPELVQAVELVQRIGGQSEGALHLGVAPWVRKAGFGPPEMALPETGASPASARVEWRAQPPALRKTDSKVRIDVNSVVEGLALDEVTERLEQRGHRNFLLELGGEVVARGQNENGQPWRVGVQAPSGTPGDLFTSLPLTDQAMATSGTYRQEREHAHGRSSHLIDPGTGEPVASTLVSVTVLHERAAVADGMATALMVLGLERGEVLAERLALEVIWIDHR